MFALNYYITFRTHFRDCKIDTICAVMLYIYKRKHEELVPVLSRSFYCVSDK